ALIVCFIARFHARLLHTFANAFSLSDFAVSSATERGLRRQKAFGLCGIGALIAPTPTHSTGVGPSFSHSRVAAMYRLFAQHHAVR
ncbi:hypothetical protein ABTF61_19380, partial [Acinetobacter baumannii]